MDNLGTIATVVSIVVGVLGIIGFIAGFVRWLAKGNAGNASPHMLGRLVFTVVAMVVCVLIILAGVLGVGYLGRQIGGVFSPSSRSSVSSGATPQQRLADVCDDLFYGDTSEAYADDFSANYKKATEFTTFVTRFGGDGGSCNQAITGTSADGKAATGTVILGRFGQSSATYAVTLIKERDGVWRIDTIVKK
jgi:hypothetical protein